MDTWEAWLFGEPLTMAVAPTPIVYSPRNGVRRSKRSGSTLDSTLHAAAEIQCGDVRLYKADVLTLYEKWDRPTVIVVDGPYGIKGFPGDPPTVDALCEWYEPHVEAWSRFALPSATMWAAASRANHF